MVDSRPLVSVIIPVFNDTERLETCLRALQRQTYPPDSFEVVVVDNGSSQDLRPTQKRFPNVRFEREDKPGSYAARNLGVEVSRGSILAFTDSDCIPHPCWIEAGVCKMLQSENAGLVGGPINVFPALAHSPTAVEVYDMVLSFPQHLFIAQWNFSATANLFTSRRVINSVGDFNADLKSGGDFEWGRRVKAAGFDLYYVPELEVAHPARRSLLQIIGKARRIEGGHHDLRKLHGRPTLWEQLYGLLTVWPSATECYSKLCSLNAARLTNILQFLSILATDRVTRILECFRLQLWGKSRRE